MDSIALTYPIHGQYKLSNEGYRTRDGHIIEWLGRFAAMKRSRVEVVSRPEPLVLGFQRRVRGNIAKGTTPVQTLTWRIPSFDRKHWWVRSASAYPKIEGFEDQPAVVWNTLAALAPSDRNPFSGGRMVVLDLLDNWNIHHGFESIRREVAEAYRRAFETSNVVFANSEGTRELAHQFGRSDAILMPNGVDPERFAVAPKAQGPLTIGYVGKIGRRLDSELISNVCRAFPGIRFVFAGPYTDSRGHFRELLSGLPNVELLGDVFYDDVPALLATFDLGWVPHAVGVGEVGGDAIKTYEYRAAGLQVLTTPILGAGRTLSRGVNVVAASDQVDWLREAIRGCERIERIPAEIPDEVTWRYKANQMAVALGIQVAL